LKEVETRIDIERGRDNFKIMKEENSNSKEDRLEWILKQGKRNL
jgi:hypothetical protein